MFHRIHVGEEDPRRAKSSRVRDAPLLLGAVALAKLLDLVAALDRGLGGRRKVAAKGDRGRNGVPVGGTEVAAAERVPFFTVGVDEGYGFVVGPAGRRKLASRSGHGVGDVE